MIPRLTRDKKYEDLNKTHTYTNTIKTIKNRTKYTYPDPSTYTQSNKNVDNSNCFVELFLVTIVELTSIHIEFWPRRLADKDFKLNRFIKGFVYTCIPNSW